MGNALQKISYRDDIIRIFARMPEQPGNPDALEKKSNYLPHMSFPSRAVLSAISHASN